MEDYGNGAPIDRSAKCELLVSAEDGNVMPAQCNFCQNAVGADLKGEVTVAQKNHFEEGQKVKEEQVEFNNDGESTCNNEDEREEQSKFDEDMFAAEDYDYEGRDYQDENTVYEDDQSYLDHSFDAPEAKSRGGLKNRRSGSKVWKHFHLTEDKTCTSCYHCQKDLVFSGTTSSMMRHLRSHHPTELQKSIAKSERGDFKQESVDDSVREEGYQQGMLEVGLKVESKKPNCKSQPEPILQCDETVPNKDSNVTSESLQGPVLQSDETEASNLNKDNDNGIATVTVGVRAWNRSVIWEYFVRIDKFTVRCNTCKKVVRAKGTSTSLRFHLERNHKMVHAEYKEKRRRELKQHFQVKVGIFHNFFKRFLILVFM